MTYKQLLQELQTFSDQELEEEIRLCDPNDTETLRAELIPDFDGFGKLFSIKWVGYEY